MLHTFGQNVECTVCKIEFSSDEQCEVWKLKCDTKQKVSNICEIFLNLVTNFVKLLIIDNIIIEYGQNVECTISKIEIRIFL